MNLITETRRQKKATRALSAFLAGVLLLSPGGLIAGQLPNGYKVAHGKVNVSVSGDVMNIEQLTNKAIVNWKDFSIGESNVVNVIQKQNLAKAIMLARVVGSNPSSILGQLNVDQSFFLVNPNGVYFGKNARVDVGAMFAASTLNITDADFLKGDFVFKGDTQKPVVNEGVINAASAALIGRNVANTGIVNAKQAALVATANSVELANFGHDAKLTLTFGNDNAAQNDADTPVALNAGTVNATDGDVILYADGGLADNSQGTLIAKDAEISGAFVDLTNLGTVTADTLLIDPKGSLTIGGDADSAPQWTKPSTDADGNPITLTDYDWLHRTSWTQNTSGSTDYTITAAALQTLLDGNDGIDANVLTLNYDQFTILDNTTITSTRDRGLTLQTNPGPENTNRLITIGNNVTFDTHGSLTLDADTIVAGANGAAISSIYGAGVVTLIANTVGSADKAISLNFDTLNLNADTAYIRGDLNTINAKAKTDATAGTLAFDVLNTLNLTLSGDLTQKTLDVSVANGDLSLASALTAATIDLAATNIYLQNTITATDLSLKATDTIIAAKPLNVGSDTNQGTVNITANDDLSLVFDTLVLDDAKKSAITSTNGNLAVTLTNAADQTLSASLAAGRDLDLTATNGSLTATGDLYAGRDLTIRVTGDDKDFTFVQSADKNISAGVNEKGTAVIGPGSITIEATGNVDIQGWVNGLGDPRPLAALDATKDILITAGKGDAFDESHDLTVNANVSANKTITMRTSGNLKMGNIISDDGTSTTTAYITTLDNGDGATLIDLAAGNDLTIDAVLGYDTNYNLFPTDAVILSAGNDLTLNTDLRVGYSADLNANHTLAIGANGPVDINAEFGDLTLNAGSLMEIGDSTLTAAKKLTLSTMGDIAITATTISADQVIVDAAEGLSFTMDADSTIEANTAISMAADTLELHGALTTFGDATGNQGDITLNALSTITSDAAITANGDLAIASLGTADLAGTLNAAGDLAIATADALTVDAAAILTAGDNLTIIADSLANDTLAGTLTATAGDISVEVNNNLTLAGTLTAIAGDIDLVAANIADAAGASITAGSALTLDASGDITLTQATIAAETYSITAGNNLTATTLVNDIVDSTFSAGNDLTLATTGKLVNTDVLALGAVDITAVSILSSDLTGGSIKLTGDADNNDSLLANTSLTTTTGNLEVAKFTSLQNVDATVAGNAALQATTIDGATVVANGDIIANATDAISASALTADGDVLFLGDLDSVTIKADGKVSNTNGADPNWTLYGNKADISNTSIQAGDAVTLVTSSLADSTIKSALADVKIHDIDADISNVTIDTPSGSAYVTIVAGPATQADVQGLHLTAGSTAQLINSRGDIHNTTIAAKTVQVQASRENAVISGSTFTASDGMNIFADKNGTLATSTVYANRAAWLSVSTLKDVDVVADKAEVKLLHGANVYNTDITAATLTGVAPYGTSVSPVVLGEVVNGEWSISNDVNLNVASLTGTTISGATTSANNSIISITATGDIANATISSGRQAILEAANITGTAVIAAEDATLTAAGDIADATVTAAGNATLTAAAIGNTAITAANGIAAIDAADLANSDIIASATDLQQAGMNLYDVDITTGTLTTAAALNNVVNGNWTVADALNLKAATVSGLVADAKSIDIAASSNVENATLKATTDATVEAQSILSTAVTARNGQATLTATAGDIASATVTAAGNATLTAANGIANATVTGADVALTATAGDLTGTAITASGTLDLTAGNTIQGVSGLASGAITVTAGNEIDGTDLTTTAGGITVADAKALAASSLIAEQGDIALNGALENVIDSTIWAKAGAVAFENAVSNEIDGTTITSATDLTVRAAWIVGSTLIAETGTLTAEAGTIDATSMLAKAGDANVTATALLSASDITAAKTVTATTPYLLNSAITGIEGVTLAGTGAGLVDNTSVITNGALDVNGVDVIAGSTFTASGNADFGAADDQVINLVDSTITVGFNGAGNLTAFVSNDMTGNTVRVDGATDLTVGRLLGQNDIISGGDLAVTGNGGTLLAENTIGANSALTLTGIGATTANTVAASSDVTLDVAGNMTDDHITAAGRLTAYASNISGLAADADAIELTSATNVENATLKATTDATIEAQSILSTAVTARNGKATLTAKTGDIASATVTAAGNATLTALTAIADTGVTALNDATLAAETITGSTVSAQNDAILTALTAIADTGVTALNNATLTVTDGSITGATVAAAAGKAALTASADVENVTVSGATVRAEATAGDLTGSAFTSNGTLDLIAGNTLQGITGYANGLITLTAGNEIDGSTFTTTADGITATAEALVSNSLIAENGDIAITANKLMQFNDVITKAADSNVTITDGGNSGVLADNRIQTAVKADLTAETVRGNTITANDDIAINATTLDGGILAADNVTLDNYAEGVALNVGQTARVSVSGAETITLTDFANAKLDSTNDGDITVNANELEGADSLLDLNADTNVVANTTIDALIANVNGDLTVTETDDLTLSSVIAKRNLTVTAGKSIAVDAVTATDTATLIANEGDITDASDSENANLTAAEVILTASGNIGTAEDNLDLASTAITATAANGLINLNNVASEQTSVKELTAGTDVIFTAAGQGDTLFTGNGVTAETGKVAISADASILATAAISAATDVTIESNGQDVITTGDGAITAASGNVAIAAENDVLLGAAVDAALDLTVDAASGEIIVADTLNAGQDIVLTAADDITLNADATAGNDLTATTQNGGDITVKANLDAANALKLTTLNGGNVKQEANTGTIKANDITITTDDGNVVIDTLEAVASVTIDADGSVTRADTDDDSDIIAPNVTINATRNIGKIAYDEDGSAITDGFIAITGAEIVDLATDGDNATIGVELNNSADVTLTANAEGNDSSILLTTDEVAKLTLEKVVAKDGDVIVGAEGTSVRANYVRALDDGAINGFEDDGYSIIIEAGNLAIGAGGLKADMDVDIASLGDITGTGNEDIEAGNDIDLAVGGQIGQVRPNIPVDVIAGGELHIEALPGNDNNGLGPDHVWVNMTGKTGDGDIIHYDGKPGTEPGIIYWNGHIWGGADKPVREVDRAQGEFMSRVSDILARYQGNYWGVNTTLYFPHVRFAFDQKPADMSLEHILNGRGVIDGLPEGVTPNTIDINAFDETYIWQTDDDTAAKN